MKAVSINSPGKAELVEIPAAVRRSGEVLLKVEYIGLCGTDLNSFRGRNPLVTYPRIPGHEIGAVIADAGSENPDLRAGTPVPD